MAALLRPQRTATSPVPSSSHPRTRTPAWPGDRIHASRQPHACEGVCHSGLGTTDERELIRDANAMQMAVRAPSDSWRAPKDEGGGSGMQAIPKHRHRSYAN